LHTCRKGMPAFFTVGHSGWGQDCCIQSLFSYRLHIAYTVHRVHHLLLTNCCTTFCILTHVLIVAPDVFVVIHVLCLLGIYCLNSTSSVVIRPMQQHKCSDIHSVLI
jgi:hypothetical protein